MNELVRIEGCDITTARSTEEILANISSCLERNLDEAHLSREWRENKPIALVGGGPSLKDTIGELSKYQFVMVCGSSHDYVMENANCPVDYAILCDPDPLIINYMRKLNKDTTYFVASQCDPKVFDYLKGHNVKVWHASASTEFPNTMFGENRVPLGGGCTIGTRAMVLAMAFGFNNLHLYGYDTCLTNTYKHHAYDFNDPDKETLGNITEIRLDPEGRTFKVAGYMLGQLFDFQNLLKNYGSRVRIEVFGDGLLKHLMDLAKEKAKVIEVAKEVS
jgi:hypothetical protein